jgi:uncharacterized protein (TIGR03067 family)
MIDMHPAPNQLAAFRLGKLDEDELDDIERHVAECDSCCRSLKSLPDDSFISLVRLSTSATLAHDSAPEAQKGEPTWDHDDTLTHPESAIPVDLLDHPRYQILERLGHGGMGVVYKAQHRLMERVVALKVLNSKLLDRPASIERFRREVKGAARLIHPNIVTAYDAEQAGTSHFLVMEYVPGISLARLVEEQGPMPVSVASAYIRQAALGLQHAFECGMVHRDIKPQNLMVVQPPRDPQSRDREGAVPRPVDAPLPFGRGSEVVKILDFGLARFVSETLVEDVGSSADLPDGDEHIGNLPHKLTQASTLMGTPEYIAPEQAQSASSADIRADIYSLGCTFYYLLAGHAPFPHGSAGQKVKAHLEDTPRPLAEIRPELPADLVNVIDRMLAKDPAKRLQTPTEVAEAILPFTKEAPKPAEKSTPAAAPLRRRHPHLALAASIAIALALVGSLFLPPVQDFAQTVIRVATNKGVLEIKAHDKDLQITILQGGETVVKAEVLIKNDQRVFELTAVDGEIEVSERGPNGFGAKSKTTFHLTRGGKVAFTAEMLLANAPAPGVLASFGADQQPITRDGVEKDQGGWRIEAKQPRTVRLFKLARPTAEDCLLIYRAQMKTVNLKGGAFLEMWCALPGQPEFFSKGLLNPVSGSTDWATFEIPFRLEKGQNPESIKLNVAIEGTGTLWIRDITLRKAPLPVSEGPAKPKTDEALIQGTWKVVRGEVKGKAVPDLLIQNLNPHVTLSGNKITWNVGLGTPLPNLEGVFHLDASKTPKTIDVVVFDKVKNQRMVVLGIYKLDGDALEICQAVEPKQPAERPKEFKTDPESFVGHIVLKREKPGQGPKIPTLQSLFNGKDLSGWQDTEGIWKWEDGRLVSTLDRAKKQCVLWNPASPKNFELTFDVRIKGKGYGGVFFRSGLFLPGGVDQRNLIRGPRADIGDGRWGLLSMVDVGAQTVALAAAKVNKDTFNHYRIRCMGKHVTIEVNGFTTVDAEVPELMAEGIFAFEVGGEAGTEIAFANIQLREFKDLVQTLIFGRLEHARADEVANAISKWHRESQWNRPEIVLQIASNMPQNTLKITCSEVLVEEIRKQVQRLDKPGAQSNFRPLFNGKDLSGWVGDAKKWKVEDKVLIFRAEQMSPLRTEKAYENYILRFEHWVEPGGSEKPLFWLALHEPTAEEAKIKERERPLVQFMQFGNGMYGVCDYKERPLEPLRNFHDRKAKANGWNKVEIHNVDGQIEVICNGQDMAAFKTKACSGHIELRPGGNQWRGEWSFRNIEIMTLPADAAPPRGAFRPLFPAKKLDDWQGHTQECAWGADGLKIKAAEDGISCIWSKPKLRDYEIAFQIQFKAVNCDFRLFPRMTAFNRTAPLPAALELAFIQAPGKTTPEPHTPASKYFKREEFNDVAIRCVGKRVTVRLNGETISDEEIPGLAAEGGLGFYIAGPLQPNAVLRNLEIRELPPPAPQPAPAAKPLSTGPQVGDKVAGFAPLHLTGPHEERRSDLVEEWGANPVVLVFTRELSSPLVSLITKTNAAIGEHKNAKLHGAVVFLGEDDWLTDRRLIGMMGDAKLKDIVLALDKAAGPPAYKLHKEASVTILLYARQTVKANFTFAKGAMTEADVKNILAELPKILPAK